MVLAGLIAALKSAGGTLADHTFLFFGAGEVSCVWAEPDAPVFTFELAVISLVQVMKFHGRTLLCKRQEKEVN